jgi:hypothetical protein
MEPDAIIVKDKRKFDSARVRRALLFVTVCLFIGIGVGYWYNQFFLVPVPEVRLESFGLDEEIMEGNEPTGELYYTARTLDNPAPYLFKLSLQEETQGVYLSFPATSFAPSGNVYAVATVRLASSSDPDRWQPIWTDPTKDWFVALPHIENGYNEVELTASPDDIYYAYTYQTVDQVNSLAIDDWNIALYNFDTKEVIVIEEATEPTFARNGKLFLYMKKDGIYSYDLTTASTTLVSNLYQNLSFIDDMAVSTDGNRLILSSPLLNLISVQLIDTDMQTFEQGRIIMPGTGYRHPIISSDGQWYMVLAANHTDYDSVNKTYKKVLGEIRQFDSKKVIKEVTFEDLDPNSVTLQAWGGGLLAEDISQ